jgi:hypothetical protein
MSLHHAAAAGNIAAVIELMDGTQPPGVKNTSGETFLHVLSVEGQLHGYLEVIKKAQAWGYSFSVEDFRGENVAERFERNSRGWGCLNSMSMISNHPDR